ncbi:uncharacterized protein V1516DRAFT_436359 [Lipomyces oligophaga]|uniref:uncharacterized protein n=1 Tax=Lipomyces oligophaga TaxID=45792 RepID=UPI0034CF86FB
MPQTSTTPRRALSDISTNVLPSPLLYEKAQPPTRLKEGLKLTSRAADASAAGGRAVPPPGQQSSSLLQEALSLAKSLPSSPDKITREADLPVKQERPDHDIQISPRSRQHADTLRMRLRLAYYKIQIDRVSTPLSELPLPNRTKDKLEQPEDNEEAYTRSYVASPSAARVAGSLTSLSTIRDFAPLTRQPFGPRPSEPSRAAARLHSLPAVMSEAAIRMASSGDYNLPSLGKSTRPSLSRPISFTSNTTRKVILYSPIKRHGNKQNRSGASRNNSESTNRRRSASSHTSTKAAKRISSGRVSKEHRSFSSSADSFTASKGTSTKPRKTGTTEFVTPARKTRSRLSDSQLTQRFRNESSNGQQFSSPVKAALPSSAIKGTPNQLGAARSLLDLGAF